MGSFTKPKYQPVSMAPQVIYMPMPSGSDPIEMPNEGEDKDARKVADSIRTRRLPETVHTSYRGVLEEGGWVPQRKSLLGE